MKLFLIFSLFIYFSSILEAKTERLLNPHTFTIPSNLKKRVNFWIDVFTEHNSWELIVHDSKYPWIIYEVLDFSDIVSNKSYSERKQKWLRRRRYKKVKAKIQKKLRSLHLNRSNIASGKKLLSPDEQLIFNYFKDIKDENKFEEASSRKRIRAQNGVKDGFIQAIYYSGRYLPRIIKMFAEMGVPRELAYLPFVESGFDEKALSKVGASGLWQIMPSTGKFFLRVDKVVDERNDPIYAARAAGKLLLQNYKSLKHWSLAVTAYNHGRNGMKNAVRRVGSADLATIIDKYRGPYFGFASANFYSSFLAAITVVKNRGEYFGKIPLSDPILFDEFVVPDFVSFTILSTYFDISKEKLTELNPGLTEAVVTDKKLVPVGYVLRVPRESSTQLLEKYALIPMELKKTSQIAENDNTSEKDAQIRQTASSVAK